MQPSHIKGVIGLHKISEFNKNLEISFDRIIAHPEYQCTKTSNDIGLY